MKTLYLFLSIFFFTSVVSQAQFSLLLEGGANYGKTTLTDFKPDLFEFNENIIGYYMSAVPKYQLTNLITIASEFQYSKEGYRAPAMELVEEFKLALHYIRVIPEIELKLLGPLSILGGVNIGYLGAKNIRDTNGNSFPVFSRYDNSDFGFLTGLNLNIKGFNFTAKYNYGLKSISEISFTDRDGNIIGEGLFKNRFLQVGVGYLIDFKM